MNIVYFDARENIKKSIKEDTFSPLKEISNFTMYSETPETDVEALSRIKDADGILLGRGISKDVIKQCKNLKIISFVGYGVKNYIDVNFIKNQNIVITNTPGYGDNAVAEHALTLLLSLTKSLVSNHNNIYKDKWNQSRNNIEVRGQTIGLVGMGSIGEQMIKLCKGLGMNVISWTFNPSDKRARELGIRFVELNELFEESDFVSIHLPYSDKTNRIIGKDQLSRMKKDSLFINTARAEIVDTNALIDVLNKGDIRGAGLDVFDDEPILKDDPILSLNNVILSPHAAFNTANSINNMIDISVDNLVKYFNGSPINTI